MRRNLDESGTLGDGILNIPTKAGRAAAHLERGLHEKSPRTTEVGDEGAEG
jgi:hypothetical protein